MPKKVTPDQRQAVLRMLAQGQDRDTIAAAVGVTPGQVSAISAHVKMGTYTLPALTEEGNEGIQDNAPVVLERETNLLRQLHKLEGARGHETQINPVLLGVDIETGDEVLWNPDQASGTPNPHVLILGESGTGKTYSVSCLTAELAQEGVVSIVFDYGQGLSPQTLPAEFVDAPNPVELQADRDAVHINPPHIF